MSFTTLSMASLKAFATDIKLSHSIFALPFVGTALVIANTDLPSAAQAGFILISMIAARSFAMGINRYLDSSIDGENERTASRAVPSGRLSKRSCLAWSVVFAGVFVAAAWQLSALAGRLAFPLLGLLGTYSYMKRISWLTHWYLGLCLGLAAPAAEVALTGHVTLPVILVGIAVLFWTAGFDLLYSLQDRIFDIKKGLKSVPAVFGPQVTLSASILSFLIMLLCLVAAGNLSQMGFTFFCGVFVVAGILGFEHWLVRDAWQDGRSSKINAAFFNANAFVSVVIFSFSLIDRLLHGNYK